MFFFYQILIIVIIILSPIILLVRLFKKKEHPIRFKEKFSIHSKSRPKGNLIWFHGASVGEILSIIPLVEKLEKNKDIKTILITSSTVSSAIVYKQHKSKKTIHQFFPIDSYLFTNKFLKYWQPSIAIFVDSEIWPNMYLNIKKENITLLLLNARITKKSFEKWSIFKKFSQSVFNKIDIAYPQNKETLNYLKRLNVSKIKKIGNLKFSEGIYDSSKEIGLNLKNFLSDKMYWCASSTHEGEELIAAKAHLILKKKIKNLILIVIPRNVQRVTKITNMLSKLGLKTHLHSLNQKIPENTNVYIVDEYGETKSFFKICKVIFLGKSLTLDGGQNPLEPARYNCNIVHGPNVSNFHEIYNLLGKSKITFRINNQNQLIKKINELLKRNIGSKNVGNRINKIGKKILNKTLIEIKKFI